MRAWLLMGLPGLLTSPLDSIQLLSHPKVFVLSAGAHLCEITIPQQFRGPPNSGNGGYVGGLIATHIEGPTTVAIRAPAPLDMKLELRRDDERLVLLSPADELIAEGRLADGALPDPPAPPSIEQAVMAGAQFPGLTRPFHPICFCCGDRLVEGFGLRVFAGQIEGRGEGEVAGPWTLHNAFADANGLAPTEIIWAALDCPGSVSWLIKEGGGGLLGTMTCEVRRRPATGERCIVTGWPIEQIGRKRFSGTALFTTQGELLAHSHQIWIGRPSTT